jgi:hypothetical protein
MTSGDRTLICMRCPHFTEAATCERSGRDVADHASGRVPCPHPDGSMFEMEPAERFKRFKPLPIDDGYVANAENATLGRCCS